MSQPGIEILASYHWALMTVSMLSAIRSLDSRLKDMPRVPIEIASLTPIVLNLKPTMPASRTPSFTASESLRRCMLQGLPSYQTDDIPTWGFDSSSSERPTPKSIAWDPPWDLGSVTRELYLFSFFRVGVDEVDDSSTEERDERMEKKVVVRCVFGWWGTCLVVALIVARGIEFTSVACIIGGGGGDNDGDDDGGVLAGRGLLLLVRVFLFYIYIYIYI